MERKLIYFDEINYKSEISNLEHSKEQCQKIIDKFKSLKIGDIKINELDDLIFKTDNYLLDKTMTGKACVVEGMKLSKEKFYDLIEKPHGYKELTSMVQNFLENTDFFIKNGYPGKLPIQYLNFFELSGINIQIKKSVLAEVKERNEVYAYKENGQLMNDFAVKLSALINETDPFNKILKMSNLNQFQNFFSRVIEFDFETQKTRIKAQGIKNYDN